MILERKIFSKKNRKLYFLLFSSILLALTEVSSADLAPIIITESSEIVYEQGTGLELIWIIFDQNPKFFWITNTFENNSEEIIQSKTAVTHSKITISPIGISVGYNLINLYVEDYQGMISNSSIGVTVLSSSPSTVTITNTTQESSSSSTGGGATSFAGIAMILISLLCYRFVNRKRKGGIK